MFCPRCGCEYRDGFTECADCGIPLVPEPPPPPPEPQYLEYEPVLATYNPGDIAVIKAVLESEGITYFFDGESFNMLRPLVQPAKLLVAKEQVQEAREVLKGLNLAYFAFPNFGDRGSTTPEP